MTTFIDKPPPFDFADPAARDLWDLLASNYLSKPPVRDMLVSAGVDPAEIDWDQAMRWVWHDILALTHRQAKLRLLLQQISDGGDAAVAVEDRRADRRRTRDGRAAGAAPATWKGFGGADREDHRGRVHAARHRVPPPWRRARRRGLPAAGDALRRASTTGRASGSRRPPAHESPRPLRSRSRRRPGDGRRGLVWLRAVLRRADMPHTVVPETRPASSARRITTGPSSARRTPMPAGARDRAYRRDARGGRRPRLHHPAPGRGAEEDRDDPQRRPLRRRRRRAVPDRYGRRLVGLARVQRAVANRRPAPPVDRGDGDGVPRSETRVSASSASSRACRPRLI